MSLSLSSESAGWPRPGEHSDSVSTLPHPELNPLLNPVLGQHMGRWAEVYFTNPPEKREQAVLELLRELEAQNAQDSAGQDKDHERQDREQSQSASLAVAELQVNHIRHDPPRPANPPAIIRCHGCGQENPAAQKFCGRCGVPLAEEADPPLGATHRRHSVDPTPLPTSEFSILRTDDADESNDHLEWSFDRPPASTSYRVYVGVALAIIILALGYIAWRGSEATSQSVHVAPPAPPAETAAAKEPAPPPAADANAAKSTAEPATNAVDHDAAAPGSAVPNAPTSAASPKPDENKTEAAATPTPAPAATGTQAQTPRGNGSEELAIADDYLNGANGHGRNAAEAAKWLWKSVALHNTVATFQLADLYLRGDGVAKNCDQARVLLDAAAIKGMKDAGERLRHLPAFGCQ